MEYQRKINIDNQKRILFADNLIYRDYFSEKYCDII